jgi:ribonuclease J
MSDSTNVQVPGHSRPEREVRASLEEVIAGSPGRVIVSMFASNVHRVHGLIDTAHRLSRRVALVGKSLSIYLDAARRSGQGITPPDWVDPHRLEQVPDRHLLVICTGSQSEPRSALYRASLQDHPDLHVHPGDTVVLSSRIIPGNERAVFRMTNNLTRLGAVVVHERMAPVHGSGHAQRDELVEVMNLVRPRTFIPIHGEYAFLKSHADLALESGLPEVRVIENGHLLEVTRDEVVVAERLPLNWHYVDGPLVGDADELRLSERKRIGWNGVIAARVSARRVRNRWKAEVDLQAVGVPLDEGGLLDEAASCAAEQIVALPREASRKALEEALVGALRSFFRKRNDKKPTILPFIEVPED